MPKNIIIQHNGTPVNHNGVKNLKIPTSDGKSMLWYPEDEVPTGGLTIYSNGEYTAAANDLFAFSHVIVNIQQATSITGTKGGKTYTVTVDSETGYLVWEENNG